MCFGSAEQKRQPSVVAEKKRAVAASGDRFSALPDSLAGNLLSFCNAFELLSAVELVCRRFRAISLSGIPWTDATVHWFNFPPILVSATYEMMAFCNSGRVRFVSELAVRSPLAQLSWLRADKLPRLRSLDLGTHPYVYLLPTALEALRPFKQLTVRLSLSRELGVFKVPVPVD